VPRPVALTRAPLDSPDTRSDDWFAMKSVRLSCALALVPFLALSCSPRSDASGDGTTSTGTASTGTGPVEADADAPNGSHGAANASAPGDDAAGAAAPSGAGPGDALAADGTDPDTAAGTAAGTGRAAAPRTLDGLEGLSNIRIATSPTVTAVQQPAAVTVLRPVDDRSAHNFGAVLEGDETETEFVLVNAGDAPVAVRALNSSCKCTLGDLFIVGDDGARTAYELEQPIEPGQRLAVRAALETVAQRGEMRHSVVLVLSDRTATRLELIAFVTPFLESDPANGVIAIGTLKRDEARSGSLTVRSSSGEPILLSLDEAEIPEYFHPTLVPLEPDADGRSVRWRLDVVAGPGVPEVQKRPAAFFLRSDVKMPVEPTKGLPAEFHKRVVVSATVTPAVVATPNFVSFGVFQFGDEQDAVVEVEITDDHVAEREPTVRIEWGPSQVDTAALEPYLTTVVRALDEGTNWRIEVTLAPLPETLAGTFQGSFVLSLDHPGRPEVVVPFSGMTRATGAAPTKPGAATKPKG